MKWLEFINKKLYPKSEVRGYINNVDETILEHYQVFLKRIKPLFS